MTAEAKVQQKKPEVFDFDLSKERADHYLTKSVIAIDTETRGLQVRRDRLCLIQMCDDDGLVSFVQFPDASRIPTKEQTNLKKLLEAKNVIKLFHFGRFDVSVMKLLPGRRHQSALVHEDCFEAGAHIYRQTLAQGSC